MKKRSLYITGIVVLVIVLAGFGGYYKYFKPDREIQQQLNDQFGAEFFHSFENENVVNNVKSVDDTNKINIPTSVSMLDKAPEETKIVTVSPPVIGTSAEKQITQDEISNKYTPKFNNLKNVALSRLDTLYSTAIQEYEQGSKAGTLNRSELVQKYIQAGTMLEASVDSQFYSALNAMQAELIANNLPTDIVALNKSEYENAKSNKRSQFLAKARK